jgi:hypothetical protein
VENRAKSDADEIEYSVVSGIRRHFSLGLRAASIEEARALARGDVEVRAGS